MSAPQPPTTIEQQLLLLEGRGLVVGDRTTALQRLAHSNYFRLCCYKFPLLDPATKQFRAGCTFELLWAIYSFDRHLRVLLLEAIERCEISFRTRWAYELAHLHGRQAYEVAGLFSDNAKYLETMNKVDEEIMRSREDYIAPFQVPGAGRPPIWMACEVISLGHLSSLFANLANPRDRAAIAATYDLDETNLKSFLHHLTILRNLCAHHSRVWNRKFTFKLKVPRKRPAALIPNFNPHDNSRIYNSLVLIAHLLNTAEPGHHWTQRLAKELTSPTFPFPSHMGFPTDWKERPIWKAALA